jgi:deazaflavin-dependent oxidoreductase (nitroreductase family)
MNEPSNALWKRALQRFFMTRPMTWLGIHVFGRIDPVLMRITRGHVFSSRGMGLLSILMTTTGAKSGQPRTVTVAAFQDGPNLFVIGSRGGNAKHPAWYHNLRANPLATVVWLGRKETRVAHEAVSPERERLWQIAMSVYPAFDRYDEISGKRRIPVIVLAPMTS